MPPVAHDHVVQFYVSEADLVERAGSRLADAVRSGSTAIVIATPEHRRALADWMLASGVDLQAAEDAGAYLALDARATMQRLLIDDQPDPARFDAEIGGLVRSAAAAGRPVVAYGEMVALLWEDGFLGAAIELESLWNALADRVAFSLFCSYPSTSVTGEDQAELLHQVCCLHSAVVGAHPPLRSSRSFGASTEAPHASREFVVETLRGFGLDHAVADAALIVTELATNAVVHARSDFTVALCMSDGAIRIEVSDASAAAPIRRTPSFDALSGRGLALVAALARAWGSDHSDDGKVVWAELALAPAGS
jgi:MEDS: MEthanogen/methylotroph, DcmR Sensory domain/Histidine kinase-like ATPase domain